MNYYIYKLTNKINNKMYIGQTSQPYSRKSSYKNLKCKTQPKIYRALKKYGWDSFTWEIIAVTFTRDQIDVLETQYIKDLDTRNNGYNIAKGGRNNQEPWNKGLKGCQVAWNRGLKGQQVAWNKGLPLSNETKILLSKIMTGRPGPNKGRKHSQETKDKMSLAKVSKIPWNKGLAMSQAQKDKISQSLLNKSHS